MTEIISKISREYYLIKWIVFVFLGSSLHVVILIKGTDYLSLLLSLREYTQSVPDFTTATIHFIVTIMIISIMPIGISLGLSQFQNGKRTVFPLHIQIITFGWVVFYIITSSGVEFNNMVNYFALFILYVMIGGMLQDRFVIWLIGISASEEDLKHFTIKAQIEKKILAHYLFVQPYKKRLQLNSEKTMEDRIILKGKMFNKYTVIEIYDDPQKIDCAVINVVVYQKGWYGIDNNSLMVDEFVVSQKDALKSILSRKGIKSELLDESLAQLLALDVLSGFSTAYSQFEMTKLSWVKVFAFVGVLGLAAYYIYQDNTIEGIAIVVMVLLYLAFDLPGRFRHKTNSL
jgi:hypothetical protein